MSDTTWDTDECERWIDNEWRLHDEVKSMGRWMTLEELESFLIHSIEWEYFNGAIDTNNVDFEHLATLYHAPPTEGPGPFD